MILTPNPGRAAYTKMMRLLACVLVLITSLTTTFTVARAQHVFEQPRIDGVRLDWCFNWATDCGKPAADRFCFDQGFGRATRFEVAEDVGPTRVLATGQPCDDPGCDGFAVIECGTRAQPGRAPAVDVTIDVTNLPTELRPLSPRQRNAVLPLFIDSDRDRVRLEALHGLPQARDAEFSPQRVQLDWNQRDLRVTLRWRTKVPGAQAGLWELTSSSAPAPPGGRPPGYLEGGRLEFGAPGEWNTFEIDVSPHAPRLPWGSAARGGGAFDPSRLTPYLFVRVRAINGEGKIVGDPSNIMILAFGTPQQPGKLKLPQHQLPPHPEFHFVRHVPLRPYRWDFQCWGIMLKSFGAAFNAGDKVNLCQSSSSGGLMDTLEGIADTFGGVIEIASDAIDWAAGVYNDAKQTALGFAVQSLQSTVGCSNVCQWAASTALDAGLAMVGLPPSVPDFDQLVDNLEQGGIDAVAGAVVDAAATQGVDIPPEVAKAAVQKLVDEAKASSGGGGASGALLKIDPAGIYSPSVIVLEARNPDPSRATVPVNVQLDNSSPTTGSSLFMLEARPVPALEPGTSMLVSFTLEPVSDPESWMWELPSGADLPSCGPLPMLSKPSALPNSPEAVAYQQAQAKHNECMSKGWAGYNQKREKANAKLASWAQTYTQGQRRFRIGLEMNAGVFTDVATLVCPANGTTCAMEGP